MKLLITKQHGHAYLRLTRIYFKNFVQVDHPHPRNELAGSPHNLNIDIQPNLCIETVKGISLKRLFCRGRSVYETTT